jgi:hypothetical protein
VADVEAVDDPTDKVFPTNKLPPIPTPPVTTAAPVVVDVDGADDPKETKLLAFRCENCADDGNLAPILTLFSSPEL